MSKQTNSKVPQIRFKGFEEEWKQMNLGGVLTERNVLQKISDNAPILAFAAGQGVIPRSERKSNNRDHLTLDQANKLYKLTEYDDIVYNPSNLKYGAIDRNKYGRGVISPIYVTFTTNEIPCFIEPIVKSEKFKIKALLYEEGTVVKRQSVKPENLLSLDVWITSNLQEQTQIGEYFRELDSLIGLHQRKHDKMVTLKKAMLQKMFPQPGTTTPEIRFKGFSGDWVEKKLFDHIPNIVDFRGRTPKKLGLDWSSSGHLALSALNVKNGYIDFSVAAHFGNNELYNSWMKGSELHKNQVLFTTEAPMGNVAQIPDDRKYILSQRVIAFDVDTSFLSEDFLAVLLRSPIVFERLVALSSGGTAKGVSQKSLSSFTLYFPSDVLEQQKIGTYFRTLDELISQHATQLQKLQQIKSACLEKMFV